jgi:hypothetical protein
MTLQIVIASEAKQSRSQAGVIHPPVLSEAEDVIILANLPVDEAVS